MEIILEGNPLSTQHIYGIDCRGKFPRRYLIAKAKTRKVQYQWEAKSQWKGKMLEGLLVVDIKLYFKDKRKHDWDNYHKLSMDSLEGIVYKSDNQIDDSRVRRFLDKENPRIEININEIKNEN